MSSLMARGEATWDNRVRFNKIATLNFDILSKIYKRNKIATSNFDILAKISKIFCSRLNLDPLPPSIGSRRPANQHCGRAAKYYKVQYKYRHVKNTNTDENSNIWQIQMPMQMQIRIFRYKYHYNTIESQINTTPGSQNTIYLVYRQQFGWNIASNN